MILAIVVCLWQIAGCLGLGMLLLRLLRLDASIMDQETLAWAWAVGVGALGVLLLPLSLAGCANPLALALTISLGLPGLLLLRPLKFAPFLDRKTVLLSLLLVLVIATLFAVGLAPPTDGDSLAYHYTRPKQILAEGRLTFLPIAVEGAIPLLVHLTYMPALALGGEQAMTLWAVLSAIFPLLGIAVVARRWLDGPQALILLALLVTTPGMLYGVGSGQVEARVIPFVFFSALALWEGKRRNDLRWIFLAGLLAGCFAAAKYFGLFFLASAGLLCPVPPRWFLCGLLFSLGAVLSGGGVYVWHWAQSGDPLFPALFTALHLPDSDYWNAAQAEYFTRYYAGAEKPAPVNFWWFLLYPFRATLNGLPGWESLRTGLGPAPLLLLPFALLAALRKGSAIKSHPLAWMMTVAFLFYAFWFFLGASQRIRHLLPIFPIVLVVLYVGAMRLASCRRPLQAGLGLLLAAQLVGLALYARPALAYFSPDLPKYKFIENTVSNFAPVSWINEMLSETDKLLFFERQLSYYIDINSYYASSAYQTKFSALPEKEDFALRWRQAQTMGITHILFIKDGKEEMSSRPETRTVQAFLSNGCATLIKEIPVQSFQSRALPGLSSSQGIAGIVRLTPESCAFERLRLANPGASGYKLTPDSAK